MSGFNHEDDWQTHPFGCDCDKCYAKFKENIEKLTQVAREMSK